MGSVQEPASEGENPVKDWSGFPLATKELLQTFLWPGVEFRSLAWPLLPQPSSSPPLFLSQSFHVLAALQPQVCLPDRACSPCLWLGHSWAAWALLVPEVWKEVAEVTPFQSLESEDCRTGMLLMDSPFPGRHLGFFSASASLQHSHTHRWWHKE